MPPGLELELGVVPWRSWRRINKDLSAGPTQPMNIPDPVLSPEITKILKILHIADIQDMSICPSAIGTSTGLGSVTQQAQKPTMEAWKDCN